MCEFANVEQGSTKKATPFPDRIGTQEQEQEQEHRI